jgi:hypothetical protein
VRRQLPVARTRSPLRRGLGLVSLASRDDLPVAGLEPESVLLGPVLVDRELADADALIGRANDNVSALQTRALAIAGLAAIRGNSAEATAVQEALAVARGATTAAGIAEETDRSLRAICAHDRSNILNGCDLTSEEEVEHDT